MNAATLALGGIAVNAAALIGWVAWPHASRPVRLSFAGLVAAGTVALAAAYLRSLS